MWITLNTYIITNELYYLPTLVHVKQKNAYTVDHAYYAYMESQSKKSKIYRIAILPSASSKLTPKISV